MPEVVVRDAQVADARGLAEVHDRAWRAAYRGLLPDELLATMSVRGREERWTQILASVRPPAATLVAEIDGDLAGFCSILPSRDEDATEDVGEIAALYVDPRHWRQGVGNALAVAALERMRATGWADATLWVLEANAAARDFYRTLGLEPDGARAAHEPSGRPEIRLRTRLQPRAGGSPGATTG